MKSVVRLAAFDLLPMLAACHSPNSDQASSPMVLKMYDVPKAQTNTLSSTLGRALNKNATVSVASPGKLLIYAPSDAQASIESAIASLRDTTPPKAEPGQMELHLWIVDAQSGDAPDDPALKELAPSLDALRQAMGPTSFHLEQTLSAMSATGHQGSLTLEDHGAVQEFDYTLGPIERDSNALYMEMDYQLHHNAADAGSTLVQLHTTLATHLGQYNVLAKAPSSCPAASAAAPAPCDKSWRLLVVRVDSADSSH